MKKMHVGIGLLILIVAIVYVWVNKRTILEIQDPQVLPSPTASMQPTETMMQEQQNLQTIGPRYTDPAGRYSFSYPTGYTVDTSDPLHIRVYTRGETQRPQSEMSDGVILIFESLSLSGTNLSSYTDDSIKQITADSMVQLTSQKQEITLNGQIGYTFTTRGLGEAKYIYVQKESNSAYALSITTVVQDPNQKGYQAQVDALLSTVQVQE